VERRKGRAPRRAALAPSAMTDVVPSISPMLASSGPVAAPASGWAFDGWRVLVFIDGDLTVRTRNGHNVTA
jgi:ATP-dependent DNA ligase